MQQELDSLKDWIGRSESQLDHVSVSAMHRLAATLDRAGPVPRPGDLLPPGWYSILFPGVVRRSEIGADGHPKRGDFLPPVPLPRRMFAGRRTTFHADLRIGDEVRKDATITGITTKQSRQGAMVFVTVRAEIRGPRGLAITEEQDLVYRGEPASGALPAPPQPAPGKAVWSKSITPDEVMLFRYSALTFNGHRIHYDYPYATQVERYPGLVMNGGLTTLLLYELARERAAAPVVAMTSRNVRPLFANQPIALCGEPGADGATARLWATDPAGALALSAEASLGKPVSGGPLPGKDVPSPRAGTQRGRTGSTLRAAAACAETPLYSPDVAATIAPDLVRRCTDRRRSFAICASTIGSRAPFEVAPMPVFLPTPVPNTSPEAAP